MVPAELGGVIRFHRTRRGMTQDALARAVGWQRTAITHIESGKRPPSWGGLERIAEVLGLRVHIRLVEKR